MALRIRATDEARPDLDELKAKLDELKGRVATARAEVDSAGADEQLADLDAKLDYVSKKIASPRIDVAGASRAAASITAVEADLDELDAKAAASAAEQEAAAAKSAGAADVSGSRWAGAGEKAKLALLGVGIGAALAVKGAMDYQAQTTRLVTSAGESAKNLGMVRQGMLGISAQTATSTSEMASGMYLVESAGFHGARGLVVLKAAAQGAKDEGADLATVSNAVTDVLVDFHMKASQAATATSQLVTAVSFGKTNFEDFSGSMSTVLPLASAMHLKLADVTGVLAEMTAHGMAARQAADDEANAMRELMKPNAAMVKEFTALGISSDEVYRKLGTAGLGGTMQWLSEVARKGAGAIGQNYTQALGKLMGTAPGLSVALMTTGKNAGDTGKAIAGIARASADAKGNVDGFSTVSQTLAFKMGAAKESIMAAGISLGEALLPAVTAVMGPIAHMLQLIAGNRAAALALAVVVGGVLAGALGGKLVRAFRDVEEGVKGAAEGVEWLIGKLTGSAAAAEAAAGEQAAAAGEAAAANEEAAAESSGSWLAAIGSQLAAGAAWVAESVAKVAVVVASNVAGALTAAGAWIAANAVMLAGIGLAVVAVAAAVYEIVKHWKSIVHGAAEAWDAVYHAVSVAVDAVVGFVKSHWELLLAILLGPIAVAVLEIARHWGTIRRDAEKFTGDVVRVVSRLARDVAHWFEAMFDLVTGIERRGINDVLHFFEAMFDWLGQAERRGIDGIVSFFETLPGRILAVMDGLGRDLFSAGGRVISFLAHGIMSGVGAVTHAISSVVDEVKSFLPFSPARKGPLSGAGAPDRSGASIARMLAEGITGGRGGVSRAMENLVGSAALSGRSLGPAGYGYGGGTGQLEVVLRYERTGDKLIDDIFDGLKVKVRETGGGGPYSAQRAFGRVSPG